MSVCFAAFAPVSQLNRLLKFGLFFFCCAIIYFSSHIQTFTHMYTHTHTHTHTPRLFSDYSAGELVIKAVDDQRALELFFIGRYQPSG